MPQDMYANRAADICAAVDQMDDNLEQMALEDLPKEEEYSSGNNTEIGGEQKQRSWLGKIGKGLSKRTKNLGQGLGLVSAPLSQEDEDTKAMVRSCRSPFASEVGGIACQDPDESKLARSVLSMMIRQMGRNLLQGQNVMNTSFPIQCCQPRSLLEIAAEQGRFFHAFLPQAARATDPVERMKNIVACFVSAMTLTSANFLKPLNPILGETLQTEYSDGSKLYMEQTCHHPPISSYHLVGPGGMYQYYGHTTFDIGFGYNRMFLNTSGSRTLTFADGGKVEIGFPKDRVSNVFWGQMHHECLGEQLFTDDANGIRCIITYAPEGRKGVPTDYFQGVIERYDPRNADAEGQMVCSVEGSWVGFVDFDRVRYWDVRTTTKLGVAPPSRTLLSDSRHRADRNALAAKDYKLGQAKKLEMEEQQRAERRLREAVHGKKGGHK
mmetsp:Transcript_38151/g.89931  ORF Transcript_38151/g.89931 Transcript_38151/m.89931 type:complete len:438 (+) Transcript_38151:138-1451(+)